MKNNIEEEEKEEEKIDISGVLSNKKLYPSKYDELKKEIENIPHSIEYGDGKYNDALAFVRFNPQKSSSYYVFVTDIVKDSIKSLETHEFGHIYFNHFIGIENVNKVTLIKVKCLWSKVKKYFDDDITKNEACNFLVSKFLNIAEDFEVNSKVFTETEVEDFQDIVEDLSIIKASENPKNNKLIKKFIEDRKKNPDEKFSTIYIPSKFGFPSGLTAEQYMTLILKNLDKFLREMMQGMNVIIKATFSNGSGKDGKNEGKFSKGTIQEDKNSSNDCSDDMTAGEKSEEGENKESLEDKIIGKGKPNNYSKQMGIKSDGDNLEESTKASNDFLEEFYDFLTKNCFIKTQKTRRDVLYNSNRRKFAGNVIIPRTVSNINYGDAEIYFLIDVSGSVNQGIVEAALNTIHKAAGRISSKSRIIAWDTKLRSDEKFSENKIVYNGGSNDLESGMKYIVKNYMSRRKKSLMFVLSDFYDETIDGMNKIFKSLEGRCFAFRYDYGNGGWYGSADQYKVDPSVKTFVYDMNNWQDFREKFGS